MVAGNTGEIAEVPDLSPTTSAIGNLRRRAGANTGPAASLGSVRLTICRSAAARKRRPLQRLVMQRAQWHVPPKIKRALKRSRGGHRQDRLVRPIGRRPIELLAEFEEAKERHNRPGLRRGESKTLLVFRTGRRALRRQHAITPSGKQSRHRHGRSSTGEHPRRRHQYRIPDCRQEARMRIPHEIARHHVGPQLPREPRRRFLAFGTMVASHSSRS